MKIAVAVTGASGAMYAQLLFERLQSLQSQIDILGVVWSSNAKVVWQEELGNTDFNQHTFTTWDIKDFYAPIASGSAGFDALIICPCSMGTLGRIASGISDNLITRAADVMLKEHKKLICVVRETPYSLVHINNMKTVAEAGGIVCPASPSFYSKPQNIKELSMTVVDRALALAGLHVDSFKWGINL